MKSSIQSTSTLKYKNKEIPTKTSSSFIPSDTTTFSNPQDIFETYYINWMSAEVFSSYKDGQEFMYKGLGWKSNSTTLDPIKSQSYYDNFDSYIDGVSVLSGGLGWKSDSSIINAINLQSAYDNFDSYADGSNLINGGSGWLSNGTTIII